MLYTVFPGARCQFRHEKEYTTFKIHSFTNLKIRDPNLRFVYFLKMYFRCEIRYLVIDEHKFESRFEIRSPSMKIRFGHKIRCRNYFCQDSHSAILKSTNLKIRKNVFHIFDFILRNWYISFLVQRQYVPVYK